MSGPLTGQRVERRARGSGRRWLVVIAAGAVFGGPGMLHGQGGVGVPPGGGAGGAGAGDGRLLNERVTLPLEAVFASAGKAYGEGEIRERISVTVRQRDRVPQTAGVMLRMGMVSVAGSGGGGGVDGGAAVTKVRVVLIEAGELRVLIRDREATAWLTWNDTTIWRATLEDGAIGPQLTRLVGPLPLAGLALAEWRADGGGGGGPPPQCWCRRRARVLSRPRVCGLARRPCFMIRRCRSS